MKTVNVIQGSDAWAAHRANNWNASDAPAMLGISPYKSRAELIREVATGVRPEVDAATQRRFDDGHRFEALARPLAEQIVGEELFPVVGILENTQLSASFDGITMASDVVFEHKALGIALVQAFHAMESACGDGSMLPEHYRVQMEQQLLVSGAERVLFMATKWDNEGNLIEASHCWYEPDLELRGRIIAGWTQFAEDVRNYQGEPTASPAPVGRSPETLPALSVQVQGMVTASNLAEFREHAMAVLGGINRNLQTDEDFATAETTCKWCGEVEQRLAAAKSSVLGQMNDIDAVCRTIDEVSAEARRIRLELDKLVKAEKESRKTDLVRAAADTIRAHYDAINATLGEHRIQPAQSMALDLGTAIKGLKTLASMRDKLDAAVAQAKISASQKADQIRQNIEILAPFQPDYSALFSDRVMLCATKAPDDLRNLVQARIAEHDRQQAAKIEAERERIRREEAEKLERERQAEATRLAQQQYEEDLDRAVEREQRAAPPIAAVAQPAEQAPCKGEAAGSIPAGGTIRTIKLGEINAALAPLSITAEGLTSIGFHSVGHDRAAKLYSAADLPRILRALADRLSNAAQSVARAA